MIIQFDVRTLYFVGAAACFICGAILWMSREQHPPSRAALQWWAAGLVCGGGSMLLLSVRGLAPDFLTFVIANTLGPWAAVLMYEGVRRFAGAAPVPWLVAGSGIGLAALQVLLGPTADAHAARMLIASTVQGGFAATSALALRRRLDVDPPVPLRWAIGFCIVFVVAHALRFGYTLAVGAPVAPTGMVSAAPGHVVMPTMFAIAPVAYAMILMALVNGRVARELWAIATVDTLTGVRTRRSFIDESRRALDAVAQSRRVRPTRAPADDATDGRRAVLMMLDMDRFKQVNDRYGHAVGDTVLVRFAELLRTMAPAGAVVGRFGGEEFCMLLPDASLDDGVALAQAICERLRPIRFGAGDPELAATVSIGLADASDGGTLEELLLAADRRLYLAKDWGRDRVVASDRPLPRPDSPEPERTDALMTV